MAALVKDTPLERFGDPEDVSNAVLNLTSEESQYATGIELSIDGGIARGQRSVPWLVGKQAGHSAPNGRVSLWSEPSHQCDAKGPHARHMH